MNSQELAFFNRQLAGMLKSGIPLEGALADLSRSMNRGPLREEVKLLEKDLSAGMSLEQAVMSRKLPDIYRMVLSASARSRDLPGFLIMLADYYQRAGDLSRRLQGLMAYPIIILLCSFGLAAWMGVTYTSMDKADSAYVPFSERYGSQQVPGLISLIGSGDKALTKRSGELWGPPILMALSVLILVTSISVPALQRWLRWRVPPFKEDRLTHFADAMGLMLRSGVPFPDALQLMLDMERGTAVVPDLRNWIQRVEEGHVRLQDVAAGSRVFPPLFIWMVASESSELAEGFARAAELYRSRAIYRSELVLQAALPAAVLMLGLVVMAQVLPWMGSLQNRLADLMSVFRMSQIITPPPRPPAPAVVPAPRR